MVAFHSCLQWAGSAEIKQFALRPVVGSLFFVNAAVRGDFLVVSH